MPSTNFILPFRPAFDSNGLPVPGAKLHFYLQGTLTRTPVYGDDAMTTELENPVVANSAGRFVNIYMDAAIVYRVVLTDEDDIVLDDSDPYGFGDAGVGVDLVSTQSISGAKDFDALTVTDEVYGAPWNGSRGVPTKNAVYDKIEAMDAAVLPVAKGGTGATAPAAARANLALVIGTHVQAYDTQLDNLAALDYAGNAGKAIKVNAGATGFELAAIDNWTLLSTTTISGTAASVIQTGLTGYNEVFVVLRGVSHNDSTAARHLEIHYSTDNGATYSVKTADVTDNVAFTSTYSGSFKAENLLLGVAHSLGTRPGLPSTLGGSADVGAAINAIKLQWRAGSFDAGTILIYGR